MYFHDVSQGKCTFGRSVFAAVPSSYRYVWMYIQPVTRCWCAFSGPVSADAPSIVLLVQMYLQHVCQYKCIFGRANIGSDLEFDALVVGLSPFHTAR